MVDKDVMHLREILAKYDYHVTKARELVFMLLVDSPDPVTMNELVTMTKGKVDRVSVYRSIELFEKLGIAHRINVGWKYKLELSDQFVAHHHHMICLNCGKVIDIEDEKHIDEYILEIADKVGFQPRSHQFEVDGYCKDCRLKADLKAE